MNKPTKFSIGQKFHYLTVVDNTKVKTTASFYNILCKCICEKEVYIDGGALLASRRKSCGCMRKNQANPQNRKYLNPQEVSINGLCNRYKQKAKIRKLSFNLNMEEFKSMIFGNCFYCDEQPTTEYSVYQTKNGLLREGNPDWIKKAPILTNRY